MFRLLRGARLKNCLQNTIRCRNQKVHCSACLLQKREDPEDEPVKFSTSKAAQVRSREILMAPERDIPVYQGPIVLLSLAVMIIYFCILREENDLDETLDIFKPVPWLEEYELKRQILEKKEKRLPVEHLEKRLAEVQEMMKKE